MTGLIRNWAVLSVTIIYGLCAQTAEGFCTSSPGVLTATALLRQHTPDDTGCYLRIHHPTQSDSSATATSVPRGMQFLSAAADVTAQLQVIPNTFANTYSTDTNAPLMEIFVGGGSAGFKWVTVSSMGNVNILGSSSTTTITNDLTVEGNTALGNLAGTDTLTVTAASDFTGTVGITGAVTVTGATGITGDVTLVGASALNVQGNTALGNLGTDTLTVTAASSFTGTVGISGAVTVTGATGITGDLTLTGTSSLIVNGATTLNGAVTLGNAAADAITSTGALSCSSTLSVTGTTTLGNVQIGGTISSGTWQGSTIAKAYLATDISSLGIVTAGTWQGNSIALQYLTLSGNTGITSVGTIATGVWQGTRITKSYVATDISSLGIVTAGTWQANQIQDSYIAGAAAWNANLGPSDIRLKTNISPFPSNVSASGLLSEIDIFTFNWLVKNENGSEVADTAMPIYGFSAQDFAKKIDHIIVKGGENKSTDPWRFNSRSLAAFMIQAIKELKIEVAELGSSSAITRSLRSEDETAPNTSPKGDLKSGRAVEGTSEHNMVAIFAKIDALSAEMDELKAANKQLRHRIEQLESRD